MGSCISSSSSVEPGGARSSEKSSSGSGKVDPAKQKRRDMTHERITRVLGEATGEKDRTGHTLSLDKILMKFNKQRDVLSFIKTIFVNESKGGPGLSVSGLQSAMLKLHTPLDKKDIVDIFEVVDLDDSDVIELKEFLVALTVAHALGLIQMSVSVKTAQEMGDSSSPQITAEDVKSVCNLILSAYLLFDPKGQGFITKKGVEKMISDQRTSKEGGNRNLLLNEDRWKEMDWDSNGEIDFPEFVQAFSGWVNIDEEDFDED